MAWSTANPPSDNGGGQVDENLRMSLIARVAAVAHASIAPDCHGENSGKYPNVMALCSEDAQTARNIVTSLTETVSETSFMAPPGKEDPIETATALCSKHRG